MNRCHPFFRALALCLIFALQVPFSAGAAPPPTQSLKKPDPLPTAPSAPPVLGVKITSPVYACKRRIYYKNEFLPCDSYTRQDGEGLRHIIEGVPDSVRYLDRYQHNRKALRWLPYVGTSSALLIGLGVALGAGFKGQEFAMPLRNVMAITGLSIFSVGFGYGAISLVTNERNLKKAISSYNAARPDDPIELKIETRVLF